jgi:lysophospholipase-2
VPYKWGQMTASLMKQFLKHSEFKTYRGMMHSSSDEVSMYKIGFVITNCME